MAVWNRGSAANDAPGGAAGGDLSGSYPNPGVAKLNGVAAALYALLASPAFTGSPTAPTAAASDNSTKLGTTAYADAAVLVEKTRALAAEALLAPLASPALTGSPTAPTQAQGDNSTKIASTAYFDQSRSNKVLTADLGAISSQTTLQNITGLGLTIGASATEIWLVKYWLLVNAANITMDVKIGFTVPASCTLQGGPVMGGSVTLGGWEQVGAATTPLVVNTQANTPAMGTPAGVGGLFLSYIVFGGGTGGTVQIQYAQSTSDAGNLIISKGSCMEAQRMAT